MEGSDIYGKFFSSTFTGSMYGAGPAVFAVWGYVIANTIDSNVELNSKMLSATLGCTEEEVRNAIAYLCQPDPHSRNKDQDGRRLVKEGEYQYRVVTHAYYRHMKNEDEKREYNRIKKQESRAKLKKNIMSNEKSNFGQSLSLTVTDTEAYTEAETEAKNKDIRDEKIKGIFTVEVPDWLPVEEWNGWMEVRLAKKDKNGRLVPWTAHCAKIALGKLERWKDQSYDLTLILNAATMGNWQGLYLPKDDHGQEIKPKTKWRRGDPNNPADWAAATIIGGETLQ